MCIIIALNMISLLWFQSLVYCFDLTDVFVWLLGGSFPTTHHFLYTHLTNGSKVTYLVKKGEWERRLPIGLCKVTYQGVT